MTRDSDSQVILIPFKIKVCDSFFTRFRGLMFRRNPIQDEGILLFPCNSIHMFFMFFSIDVVFVNQDFEVIKVISSIKPWRISPIVRDSYYVLELPMGSIESYRIGKGKKIKMLP